ncbi:MAG: hypothetical protein HY698_00415 [Deltaproteobacteria bacterium]|nr:hypothetical protein [Deltaproteobacteria bacterium]
MSTSAFEVLDKELEQMIVQQRRKCLELARRLRPGLTEDDITQPHDFAELQESWHFNYEDGFLSGLLAAQVTVRRAKASSG